MREVTVFRGAAGEVAAGFVHPLIFFTAIPVLMLYGSGGLVAWVFSMIFRKAPTVAELFTFLLFFGLYTATLGRFAVSSSRGAMEEGMFSDKVQSGETRAFVLRFMVATLMWAAPLFGLFRLLARSAGSVSLDDDPTPSSAKTTDSFIPGEQNLTPVDDALGALGMMTSVASIVSVVYALTVIVMVVMPLLTCIVATRAESFPDIFKFEAWLEPLTERRQDFLALCCTLFGAIGVAYVIYLAPAMLVIAASFRASTTFGVMVMGFMSMLPLALSPILLGRLTGVFVYGGRVVDLDQMDQHSVTELSSDGFSRLAVPTQYGEPSALLRPDVPPAPPAPPKPTLEAMQGKAAGLTGDALTQAIQDAEAGLRQSPRDPHLGVELCLLLSKAGQTDRLIDAAAPAVANTLAHGLAPMAMAVMRSVWADRAKLKLDTAVLDNMGRVFLAQNGFVEAAWCLHAAGVVANDELRAQKGLLEAANRAAEAKQPKAAAQLYQFFLKKYPGSQFVSFVTSALEAEQRKLQ